LIPTLLVKGVVVGEKLKPKFLDYPPLYLLLVFLRRNWITMPSISAWRKSIASSG